MTFHDKSIVLQQNFVNTQFCHTSATNYLFEDFSFAQKKYSSGTRKAKRKSLAKVHGSPSNQFSLLKIINTR